MRRWRLLDTPPMCGASNMALDETVIHARAEGEAPDTLRFMQVKPRAVLVGFHQSVEQEVREEYCARNGIEINRRITGGGALFFDESQIGWELFASRDHPGIPRNVEKMYAKMCEGAVLGLAKLGINARFRPKNDIEVNGRKISGTGGTFEGNAFLFQGTLLVDFDASTMLRALRIPIEKLKDKEVKSISRRVTWLSEELGGVPGMSEIKKALVQGFSQSLGVEFVPSYLTAFEKKYFKTVLPRFKSDEWIYSIRRPPESRQVLKSALRSRGGLIRASLVANGAAGRINYALITGDFFAFPKDTILNLEAHLKDLPLDIRTIKSAILNFFKERKPTIPFTQPEDFASVICEAAKKISWGKFGIPPHEVNSVFPVAGRLGKMRGLDTILLPYCAKPLDCRFRKRDGCGECGRCSIGEMYALARELGMQPVSINSYRHLSNVLRRLKREGSNGFVGSCCESFYIKHQKDFDRYGVPGILIDIDSRTCYDLYKDAEAHAGKFDRQTRMKTELLLLLVRRFGKKSAQRRGTGLKK